MDAIMTTPIEIVEVESGGLNVNPAALYLARLSPSGRRTQKQALDTIAGLLSGNADALAYEWGKVRIQHTSAVRAMLISKYAPATVNKMLSALRGALKQAWLLGQVDAENYHKAASVEAAIGETLPAGRELAPGEISALLASCESDPTNAGARDGAIIALLYSCGLRREETVTLDMEDYDPETGKLIIRGKRRKERTAYIENGAALALGDWLAIRGEEPGPLFWPINKAGKLSTRRMTTQAVYNMLQKRAEQAGVKSFSPHDFRRTYVSDLLDKGADIALVAKMAGHANVQTTARYDRRPEAAKQRAARLLHVPYHGRAR